MIIKIVKVVNLERTIEVIQHYSFGLDLALAVLNACLAGLKKWLEPLFYIH